MKIYITKYALSAGIIEADAIAPNNFPNMRIAKHAGAEIYLHKHSKSSDFEETREEAIKSAEKMREKKIKSLEQQIQKLKKLKF